MKKQLLNRSVLAFLLIMSFNSLAQSTFKFRIPQNREYPENVRFACSQGEFKMKKSGLFELTTSEYHKHLWIQVKNEKGEEIDSFETHNLSRYLGLFAGEIDLSRISCVTVEMLTGLHLHFRLMEVDSVIAKGPITRAAFFGNSHRDSSFWMRTFNSTHGHYDLEGYLPEVGGSLGINDMLVDLPSGAKAKVSSAYFQVVSQETYEKVKSSGALFTKVPVVIKTKYARYGSHKSPLAAGYVLKGTVEEDSQGTFNDSVGDPNLVQVIKSVSLKGMYGEWEIYLPNGNLYASGTIKLVGDYYCLEEDWVIHNKKD